MKRCLGFDLGFSVKAGVELNGNFSKDDCLKKGEGSSGKYDLNHYLKKKKRRIFFFLSMRLSVSAVLSL